LEKKPRISPQVAWHYGGANMWSKLKFFLSKWTIKIFGDVQFFPSPLFCLLWGDTHYKVKGDETRAILNELKKGDIILSRYDRYVSSWFIPGFYTHVALYIGDDRIVEAVTKGVKNRDILSLLRTDYICILRPQDISEKEIDKAVKKARMFVGSDYDYIFDNDTDDKIYCCEVPYKAYDEYLVDQDDVISPDDYRGFKNLKQIHESRRWRIANDKN
jgi:hypothetical protein